MTDTPREKCPKCGSEAVGRDAVDIGVGTQYGPLGCFDCGWFEVDEAVAKLDMDLEIDEEAPRG